MIHVAILHRSSGEAENVLRLLDSLPVSISYLELSPHFVAHKDGIVVINDMDGDCHDVYQSINLNGSDLIIVSTAPDKYRNTGANTVISAPLKPKDFIQSMRVIINKKPNANSYFIWRIKNKSELLPQLREKLGNLKNFKRFLHLQTTQHQLFNLVYNSLHLNSNWSTQPLIHLCPQNFSEDNVHHEINSVFDAHKPPPLLTMVLSEIDAYSNDQTLLLKKIIFFEDEFIACMGRLRIMTSSSKTLCDTKFRPELLLRLEALTVYLPDLSVLIDSD